MLQTFLATMAVMTLSMAALVWGRERQGTLLQTIIDRIPVMISVYEPNTKVVRLNRAFEELTGWTTAKARGIDLMAQCYPDPAYRARIRAYMDASPPGWQDVDMTTKDGRVIATSWTNVRLADDTRVGIGLDVRERKRVEAERERAQAETEAASQAKDEFFAMLGHELRNPLGVITTALHVLEVTGPLDERGAKAREIIARQVVILVRLVDDLLDVTRLATGKIVLSPSPVNLGAAAQAHHLSRARRPLDSGRRNAPRADSHEPVAQCHRVHARRRPGHGGRDGRGVRRGPARGGHGGRHSR